MPLVSLDQLKTRFARDNQKESVDDVAVDDVTFQAALDSAEQDIWDALEDRGYQDSEIAAGDRLYEFHMSQSLYQLYFFGGVPHGYDLKQLEGFDRTKLLAQTDYGWRVNKEVIWPGSNTANQAAGSHGFTQLNTQPPACDLELKTW